MTNLWPSNLGLFGVPFNHVCAKKKVGPFLLRCQVAFAADRVWVDLEKDLIPGGSYYLSAPADAFRDETGTASVGIGLEAGEVAGERLLAALSW